MDDDDDGNLKPVFILYGSQTGNAEDVAVSVWRDGHRRSVPVLLYEMDDFRFDQCNGAERVVVVMVCSTTGQGEMPENARRFWRNLLKSSLPADHLRRWLVAVLGLGDSSYQRFNFAAKKLFRRLLQLGARPLLPLALADDQHELGFNAVVEEWRKTLWTVLEKDYVKTKLVLGGDVLPPKYQVKWLLNEQVSKTREDLPDDQDDLVATVETNQRLTPPDHFQDVRHLALCVDEATDLRYMPGDAIRIHPQNLRETVDLALSVLDSADLDKPFYLISCYPDVKLPPPALIKPPYTFRKLLEVAFDLQAVPRPSFFAFLANFADSERERERLKELSSFDGLDDLFDYCSRPKRTVAEVLRDFEDTAKRVPALHWFELFSWIKPRYFSIASCRKTSGHVLDVLVAVVNYRTVMATPRQGLCSTWLSRLPVGARLRCSTRRSSFVVPADDVPCLLVGTGTGVAPLRSLLLWRSCRSVGNNHLVFGCRNRAKDFYFRHEFERMSDDGLLHLIVAFSRDQPQKRYVQHRMLEQKQLIYRLLIGERAVVWLCGNASTMPDCVLQAFRDILVSEGQMDPDQAAESIKQMQRRKVIHIETWT